MVDHRILSMEFPVLYSRALMFIHFMYNSLYWLIYQTPNPSLPSHGFSLNGLVSLQGMRRRWEYFYFFSQKNYRNCNLFHIWVWLQLGKSGLNRRVGKSPSGRGRCLSADCTPGRCDCWPPMQGLSKKRWGASSGGWGRGFAFIFPWCLALFSWSVLSVFSGSS